MPVTATSIPVLVTGASSGIGEEFARRFAQRGHDLTVVARRAERLERLADELQKEHGVAVTVLPADLETARGRGAVAKVLRGGGSWVLVNNAGYGTRGRLGDLDAHRERAEVQVNVVALHELSLAVLPALLAARSGGIINVASTAAFQPLPFMATYGATKAFVLHFTEALAEELRGSGVRAMALAPGPVRTEFGVVADVEDYMTAARAMPVGRCVAAALRAFDRGTTVCVPGALNLVLAQGPRLAPRVAVRKVTAQIFKPRG
jgi:short-subunit dehydrogenase